MDGGGVGLVFQFLGIFKIKLGLFNNSTVLLMEIGLAILM
jgi:hypothetical protein